MITDTERFGRKECLENRKLMQLFRKLGIKKFRLISLGNSIASGYSFVRKTKPLLLRNNVLIDTMNQGDIQLDIHHFARAQNNSDEHIFDWLINNIKESEIHRMNRNDHSNSPTSMITHGLTEEDIEKYYPLEMTPDEGLQDLIMDSEKDLANIVIYNGATGSFLDGITRQGNFFQQFMHGVNRDVTSLEATLKVIHNNNRKNNGHTQIYLCGVPNLFGIYISELINRKLKKLAKKYANVVYIEPIKTNLFYEPLDSENHRKEPDIHYDEEEYREFNENIIESINKNYQMVQALIDVDRKLYHLSTQIELENQELLEDTEKRKEKIEAIIEEAYQNIKPEDKVIFLKRLVRYIIERAPYDFYYLNRNKRKSKVKEKNRK